MHSRISQTRTDVATLTSEFLFLVRQSSEIIHTNIGGVRSAQGNVSRGPMEMSPVATFDKNSPARFGATPAVLDKAVLHEFLANDNPQSFGDDYTEAIRSCLHLIEEKQDVASTEELSCLFDACISLLISGLINDKEYLEDPRAKDPQVGSGILRSIQRFTVENIADSKLSTVKVAGYFGITPRYLQKLFANDGTTFKTFVAGVRLEQVKADLLDPSIANSPAGDIALRWGFRDMTTFHRNFRRRFGETPGQMRSRERK